MEKNLYIFSKKITKKYGKNYYRASSLFPKEIREATFLYYAWTRIPDEYVDSILDKNKAKLKLDNWIRKWKNTCDKKFESKIHEQMYKYFVQYNVPFSYSEAFLKSMTSDLTKSRFETYDELKEYMYGSAVVVGLTMLCFFKQHKNNLIKGASALGEAMQLGNFLRDIKEDVDILDRIYIPQEDLRKFNLTDKDISQHIFNDNFKELMKFEISRYKKLQELANPAIEKLPYRIKVPIRIASRNYEGMISEIEKSDYDIWSKRHSLSKYDKFKVIIKSFFS